MNEHEPPPTPPEEHSWLARMPSSDRMSNGKLALVFFSPILIFGISVGLAFLTGPSSESLLALGLYGGLIAMFIAPGVIAHQFNLASSTPSFGRAVAFFLLAAIAEAFMVFLALLGGCYFLAVLNN